MIDWDIVRFEFKINFKGISHVTIAPTVTELSCNLQIMSDKTLAMSIYVIMAYLWGIAKCSAYFHYESLCTFCINNECDSTPDINDEKTAILYFGQILLSSHFDQGHMHTQIAKFRGQHGAHLGPVGPRLAPCWPHEQCYWGSCPRLASVWVLVSIINPNPKLNVSCRVITLS